jgi:CRP-like cAMP-binding protein/predicted GNAT family N-acyltransferase
MPISFKVAKTAFEKNLVYKLRHQVFVAEEKRFEHSSDKIYDIYDTLEETKNILAMEGGVPIGSIRVTMENALGLPPLEHYDFGPIMKQHEEKFAGIGWLCVSEKYRKHRGLVAGLFKMMAREMKKNQTRHLIAPLHPGALPLLKRYGVQRVGERFFSGSLNVPMVPIYLCLDALPPGAREFSQDPLETILDDSNERRIYRQGEVAMRAGEPGTETFVIMRGSFRVVSPSKEKESSLSAVLDPECLVGVDPLLGPGQIFGELSLLDEGPRTATVVCHSKEADVMIWTREEFLDQLGANRNTAMRICRILGSRLRLKTGGCRDVKPQESLVARIIIDASRQGKKPVELKWLSMQCGMWLKDMKQMIDSWAEKGLVKYDDPENIRLSDSEALRKKIPAD